LKIEDKIMKIGEIIKDAVKYPFLDWKKILILGIILLIGSISFITRSDNLINNTNMALIWFLGIIAFLLVFLVHGYGFKIMISSLKGMEELPKFNALFEMFKNGIKVFIVGIVYNIPAILIILIVATLSYTSNPSLVVNIVSGAVIWFTVGGTGIWPLIAWAGIWFFISILYVIIIAPITAMAIAHMANNESKLGTAFKFQDILDKIGILGWKNLITWYLTTGIVFLILILIVTIIFSICLVLIHSFAGTTTLHIIEKVSLVLILYPYLYMYLYRSIALFYKSKEE
jgi:hypothetical protein